MKIADFRYIIGLDFIYNSRKTLNIIDFYGGVWWFIQQILLYCNPLSNLLLYTRYLFLFLINRAKDDWLGKIFFLFYSDPTRYVKKGGLAYFASFKLLLLLRLNLPRPLPFTYECCISLFALVLSIF